MKQVVLRLVGVALAGLALGCPQPHTNSPSAADAHADAPTHEQAPAHAGAPHWTYEGEHGPERWGDLAPEFALAKEGKEQSPIDLAGAEGAPLPPIEFVHAPTAAKVVDNGHTIKVALAPGCTAEIGGVVYELLQFHFHHPSEHTVEGKAYPAEVHLVHKDPAGGGLGVVGVFFEPGAAHPVLDVLWGAVPAEVGVEGDLGPFDPGSLLPEDRTYFHYAGSLTTPPCTEGVSWNVYRSPVPASQEQLDWLAQRYPLNARPVQPLNARKLQLSQ